MGTVTGRWTGRGRGSWTGYGAGCDEAKDKDWTVSADSTVVSAQQHAADSERLAAVSAAAGGCLQIRQFCSWSASRGRLLM
jgi:uncharacterized protein YfaQ (DUF2300 family)